MTAHARIKVAIWRDLDFRDLSVEAQWAYHRLLSDSNRNHAGVLALTRRRWTISASGMTPERLDAALDELVRGSFIVLDEDTEEVLVRTYMRHNDVGSQPNVLKAALRQAAEVDSPLLRSALAHELRLLPAKPEDTPRMAYPDPHAVAEAIDPGDLGPRLSVVRGAEASSIVRAGSADIVKGSANPSENPSEKGSGNPEEKEKEKEREWELSCAPAPAPARTPARTREHTREAVQLPLAAEVSLRPDVEALCERLHSKLIENDYKPLPAITAAWRRDARLLLDKDERNLDQALRLIVFALDDEFWSTNIASMGKFRVQYPKLLAKARRERAAQTPPVRTGPTRHDQRILSGLALAEKYQREEDAERASQTARRVIEA